MAKILRFDNEGELSFYVASVQAKFDQLEALHSELASEWEDKRFLAVSNGETELAQSYTEALAEASELKREGTEHMKSLVWARDNLFSGKEGE